MHPAGTGWPKVRAGWALQVYLALIAAQLLLLHTGQRPGKRQMELIQFYLLG